MGWKALSSMFRIIQCVVQFVAAIALVGLYVRYLSSEVSASLPSLDLSESSSRTIQIAIGATDAFVLPVSVAFLFMNEQSPWFDPDELANLWFIVHVYGLGIWMMFLLLASTCFVVLPFVHQAKTVRALHGHSTLSLVSLVMQAVTCVLLGVM